MADRTSIQGLTARALFRQASRLVLQSPADLSAHEERVRLALELEGVEPLQGSLVDMLVACPPSAALETVLRQPAVQKRLSPVMLTTLLAQSRTGERLPRVNKLATRWCVLALPSLDVPSHALLCGADDSRAMVARYWDALLAEDKAAEQDFLAHCVISHDVLAFMLARKELGRHRTLSLDWSKAMETLQRRMIG